MSIAGLISMFLLAVHLGTSLKTTSKSIGRGEEGIDAPLLFLGVLFFPAEPGLFVSKYAVAAGEGALSLASGIRIEIAAAFALLS